MNYRECLAYLDSIQKSGIKFGLNNVRTVLRSLGHPEQKYPSVHVAGTNGKGSVCAMLARILSEHGFRTGLYTSPHLAKVEERFRVGDGIVSRPDFCRLMTDLRRKVEELVRTCGLVSPPTHFEHLTCLGFQYFAEQQVDAAVVEVGMGGRFDATNVITPVVSVITSIAKDHLDFLGTKIGQIAFEKAGIIKPGVPVVSGVRGGEARRVIRKRANELGAPLIEVFGQGAELAAEKGGRNYRFIYRRDGEEFVFTPSLPGLHQGWNAAVAITAAGVVGRAWKPLDRVKIIRGLEKARWEGRLEVVGSNPRVILDGAHNEDGAAAVSSYLRDFTKPPRVLVFAVMKDKAIKKMARFLFPLADHVVLTHIPYARAAKPEDVRALLPEFAEKTVLEPDAVRAVHKAVELAGRRGTVVAAGSLFLVGAIKKRIRSWHSAP